ncbi:DJ-1/PfpI family protein [Methylosinus sp. Sm6]|nr:DJ-1/PfpI family protein [Methylosinus sp. Sm6]
MQARGARRVVIVAAPPVRMIDVFGPAEVFTDASRLSDGEPAYRLEIVSAGEDSVVAGHAGAPLLAGGTYRELRDPIDTLLVAGGPGAREARYEPAFLEWLEEQSAEVRRLGSICTGALILAAAGLLDGRRATTHWNWCGELADKYPRVKVDPDPIYVKDGNIYTSAGVMAGVDLALAMVEEDLGGAIALRVARQMVVFLRRPGGQSQFSATLAAQSCADRQLGDLLAWIADNVDADLSVSTLARRVAMSPRNFARVFAREAGMTPARHVERIRLETARRQLETTSRGLDEIARLSGFSSAEILRRAFARHLGVTPGRYRASFGRAAPLR